MKRMKDILFFYEILKARIFKRYIPFAVQFSITSKCNSRCNYCYAKYFQRNLPELDTNAVKRIIDQLSQAGTRRLSLVGGEPLIREDIGEIIDYIKSKNIECVITSNGYLLSHRFEEIKNIDLLCLSFDGKKKNHDANREKGSWKKTMRAIKIAYKNKIPLQVSTVLTKNNLNDIEWLSKQAKKYNFLISFTPLINQSEENKKVPIFSLLPTQEEYRKVFRKIISMKKKNAPFLYDEKVYQATLNWPNYQEDKIIGKEPNFRYIRCNAGRYSAIIDSNGDLYPCPQLVDVIKVKNIVKDGFDKAWKHIHNHQCRACFSPCSNNLSLVFSLNPYILYDIWKNYKKKEIL